MHWAGSLLWKKARKKQLIDCIHSSEENAPRKPGGKRSHRFAFVEFDGGLVRDEASRFGRTKKRSEGYIRGIPSFGSWKHSSSPSKLDMALHAAFANFGPHLCTGELAQEVATRSWQICLVGRVLSNSIFHKLGTAKLLVLLIVLHYLREKYPR